MLLGTSLEGFMPVSYILFFWFSEISHSLCFSEVRQCTPLCLRCLNIELFLVVCMGAGRPIIVDFSPVTDFREATCRQYEENTCNRGGYCNFMHLKRISR